MNDCITLFFLLLLLLFFKLNGKSCAVKMINCDSVNTTTHQGRDYVSAIYYRNYIDIRNKCEQ